MRWSGTEEGMRGDRGCVRSVSGYPRSPKGGSTEGVMSFITALHWGHIRGFLGGRRGTQWGPLGVLSAVPKGITGAILGALREGAKGSRCGV